jgi:TrmH family RNA methyltransferase
MLTFAVERVDHALGNGAKFVEQITSRRNPIVARFREARHTATPPDATVLLEGPRLIAEALAAGLQIDLVAVSTGAATARRTAAVFDRLDPTATRLVSVSPTVMEALSPVSTPSGLVALATLQPASFDAAAPSPRPLVVGLLDVQDPGNTGAVIRAVEAGGATGVVSIGGADPYGWKALRGAMGSAFRLPVVRNLAPDALRAETDRRGLRVLAAVPRDGTPVADADLSGPCLIWLGGEGGGLDTDVVADADDVISISMRPPVESLNIAVAAALIVYEAARQRADTTPRATPGAQGQGRQGRRRSA